MKVKRILLKWKFLQDKNYAILAAKLRKRQISFVPASRDGVVLWENFHTDYIPRNRLFERVARRDQVNRVDLVDRGHMKRPSIWRGGRLGGGGGSKIFRFCCLCSHKHPKYPRMELNHGHCLSLYFLACRVMSAYIHSEVQINWKKSAD